MTDVSFDVTDDDFSTISRIVRRALTFEPRLDQKELHMDITATHANGCPLRLQHLLNADDFNFVHDVFGIHRHINRETGKLDNHFLPRFSEK